MTLWQIRTVVDDEPGRLAALAGSLAVAGVNILSVQVHPVISGAVDDFVADAPADLSADDLVAAVAAGGGRRAVVRAADVHGLADPPTRAIQLAGRLVRDPESLPLALAQLIDGGSVRWTPAHAAGSAGSIESADAISLRDPHGGTLVVSRLDTRLTPSEAARARALTELAGALERGTDADEVSTSSVRWRRPGVGDLDALADMHVRCSSETTFRRYNSGVSRLARRQLARLVNPRLGVALVAEASEGRVVALGNLMWSDGRAELGLLVEDGCQERGLGRALIRRLLTAAVDADLSQVYAVVRSDNVRMLRLLNGLGLPTHRSWQDGMLTVAIDLPADGQPFPLAGATANTRG